MPTCRRAFTIVEMLVVIVILAVLFALLSPVLAKVREKSRQSTCLSNQRQIGIDITTEQRDAGDRLPTTDEVWAEIKYTKDVLKCPSNIADAPNSYGFNAALSGQPYSAFESASTTILIGDAVAGANNIITSPDMYDRRHNGRFIACFLDTHVKLIKDPPTSGDSENY